jgi:ABC-type polar amino acid transport system ATPase subunit
VIEVRGVVKAFGGARVLDGATLTVRDGEVTALVGPSGGGKSTLLRCVNGLEPFDGGTIAVGDVTLVGGKSPAAADLLRLRRRVGMVFQQFHLFPHLSVIENVLAGPVYALGQHRDAATPRAKELLERVGLADKLDARPSGLSGGQQQRVAIARALAVNPAAILFDEPTSALDPHMAGEVLAVMRDLARSGMTMIVVSHDMGFVRQATTVHRMAAGKVVASGPPAEVLHP